MNRKLLVIQIAGLGHEFASRHQLRLQGKEFQPMQTVFPAVTCPVQASFRTAQLPSVHGVVSNGSFDRAQRRTAFWEQSSALVSGPRIWEGFRRRGRKVAMLFWQQSLGEEADIVLSPAPIHKHHGGMIEDCYAKPADLYARLCSRIGRSFRLAHYWGPFASWRSSEWIAEATAAVLQESDLAPDLCLTYLPVLDYDLQRHGSSSEAAAKAAAALRRQIDALTDAAARGGYDVLAFGDYAIADCSGGAVFPNRALRKAGLLATRSVRGMLYPDLHESRAFALCDHEVAHVFVRPGGDVQAAAAALAALDGVDCVMGPKEQATAGVNHERSGDFVLVARVGRWLAYPWWEDRGEAPEYAGHVDIHSKPGYDPCELFLGWPPGSVSLDASRILGSHGRCDASRQACWASNAIGGEVATLVDLAKRVRDQLESV